MARHTTNRSISVILTLSLAVVMTSAMLFNGLKEAAAPSEDQQQLQQTESKVIYTIYESINKNQIHNVQFKTDNSQFKRAPEFTDITGYLNTNPDLKLTDLKGNWHEKYHLRRARKGKETLCTTRWHTAVKLCRGR